MKKKIHPIHVCRKTKKKFEKLWVSRLCETEQSMNNPFKKNFFLASECILWGGWYTRRTYAYIVR